MLIIYLAILGFAAIISICISYFSWKRRPANASIPLAILMLCVSEWILAQILTDVTADFSLKLLFDRLKYLGVTFVPFAWLLLALQYTKNYKYTTKKYILSLIFIPVVTNIVVFTNDKTGLFHANYRTADRGFIMSIEATKQIWFWVHTYYSYAYILAGTIILVGALINLPSIYRKQTFILLFGAFIPWVGNILNVFGTIKTPFTDITPITLIFTGLLFFWALFRYKLLDLVPIARHAIFENMKDLIIVLDNQNRIIDVNPAARKAISVYSKEIIGLPVSKVLSLWSDLVEKFSDLTEANEKICIKKQDISVYYDFRMSPIYDKGELTGKLLLLRDITRLEEVINELEVSKNAAEAASLAKSRFLATMSHEIRTPMNAIIGMSDLLASTKLDDTQKNYLEIVRSSADSLLNIINDILDFSKIEAGKLELECIVFDIRELVKNVCDGLSIQAGSKGLRLTYQIGSDIPSNLIGDPTRIRQILVNLIGNAIKFTQKGSVDVNVNSISSMDSTLVLRFTISDTGIGIPAEKIDNLFEMFHQLDNSHARKFGGTGLGLAIVKKLVQLMNGTINVDSKPGMGSCFTFELPFEFSDSGIIIKDIESCTSDDIEKELYILLAEDNKTNQLLMKALIKKFGWKLDIAVNGIQAVNKYASGTYDLILMDIQMPEMDGFEASRTIREKEQEQGKHIPIIALTANAMKGDKEKCLESGMDDYLTKPVKGMELYETIKRHKEISSV